MIILYYKIIIEHSSEITRSLFCHLTSQFEMTFIAILQDACNDMQKNINKSFLSVKVTSQHKRK